MNSNGLKLADFEPKSVLAVPESRRDRPRFPVIDFHAHLSFGPEYTDTWQESAEPRFLISPERALAVMESAGIRLLVNLTGGCGHCLDQALERFSRQHPGHFAVFVEPWWQRTREPGYPQFQADELARARKAGARGLKLLKILGLFLRERAAKDTLVTIDDTRFDPMWEAAGALGMPVVIHTSDPEAFFLPVDRFNERYEELNVHPDWSFYGNFPSNRELHEARNRVIARHPGTHFVLAHVGNAENLGWVAEWLDRYPNVSVDIAARIGELGRQPRTARRFFDRFQDRILFGTDATPDAVDLPQQTFCEELYQIYYRFLETEDDYFDYSPARVPPQGRWRIYGIGLSASILRKVYWENAARLLGIDIVSRAPE